ncbi:MAG: hypothetical protein HN742_16025 [Lentisphaerae bacterium]|jgi:hypothetical protein|nr:hypothetical protein [Lentisphaerota bacterium]MBT4823237.1 hypothetical protein [Lentisphaerota bacterium]MBT5604797.1 hypothetical protein [Lentisphaerota bacterium]MBT7053548.1 hypothetical protein [Lentisphaerota bacterium]MBT7843385.1 hypothetical protein [Lentisphaerota bacterium]
MKYLTTLLIATCLSVSGTPPNLVIDGSFEHGQATFSPGSARITGGRTGSYAARITRASEQDTPEITLPPIPLHPGRFLLSAWMRGRVTRGADRNFSVEISAIWLGADGHVAGRSRGPSMSGPLPVWDYREATVKAPMGTSAARIRIAFTGAVVGHCEIDDTCLTVAEDDDTPHDLPDLDCRPAGPIMALDEPYRLKLTLPATLGHARKVICQATVRDSLGVQVGSGESQGEIPAKWRNVIEIPLVIPEANAIAGEWLQATVLVQDAASTRAVARGDCGVLILPRPADFRRKPDSPFAILVGHPYTKRWLGARWDRPNLCNERLLEVAKRYGVSRMPLMTTPHERIDEPGMADAFRQKVTDYVRANARHLDYLQVGNEPPLFRPGVTERYVTCLRIAYKAAKAVRPSIKISSAGITGLNIDEKMVARMLDAGAADYCDMIDIHAYLSLPEMDRIIGKVRRQMADRKVDKPLILTEVTAHLGSPISERAKAGHVYQRHAISLSHGIEQIYWFVLHWVNSAPGGFRYCGLIDSANHAPWPAAAAYARMTSVLEGRHFEEKIGAGSPGTHVYTFRGPDGQGIVAWNDVPGSFARLQSTGSVVVYDVNGRRFVPGGTGPFHIELTDEPILIDTQKAVVTITQSTETGTITLARGNEVPIALLGFPQPSEARLAAGISVVAAEEQGTTLHATPDAPLGRTEAWFSGPLEGGGRQLRRASLTVTDPLQLNVQPVFRAGVTAFRATVRNCGGQTTSGDVVIISPFTRGPRPEALRTSFRDLAPGQSRSLLLPVTGACDPQHAAAVNAWAVTAGGARADWSRRVSFLAASRRQIGLRADGLLADWSNPHLIHIGPLGAARRDAPGSNPDVPGDLSAEGSVIWDDKALHLLLVVTDDVHRNERQDASLWDGDSIQLGFARDPGREGVECCEISVGLGTAGPQAWIHRNFGGCATGAGRFPLMVRRQGTRTTYELAIPWELLGIDHPVAGLWLGLGLVLNESDSGKRGWLGWHQGIATDKNPALYGQIVLTQ